MRRIRRPTAAVAGRRESQAIAANLGRDTRSTRRKRRLTQQQLGERVGLGQSQISYLERGFGSRTSIESWVAIGIALDRPIAIGFGRDIVRPLADAGHIDAQELGARLARGGGWLVTVEAVDDELAPSGHTDLRLTGNRDIALVEIWNRLDDLGAAMRSSDRKLVVVRRGAPGRVVQSVWLLVDTAANREIVRRYPAVLGARFRGSSSRWVRAITKGESVPPEAGVAWIDVRSGGLRALRFGDG